MRRLKSLRLFAIPVIILALLSCNAVPAAVRGLFASPTPTATHTPTATSTPTNTPTPTSTPLPAVTLIPCAFVHHCPESNHIFELIKNETVLGMPNLVDIPYDEPVSFHAGWVTIDDATLAQNMYYVNFFFEVDGQDYYDPSFTALDVTYSSTNPNVPNPSIFTGVMTTGWKIGEPHSIRIGFTLDHALNDGWDDYPAGHVVEYEYVINPLFIPTSTPTLTPEPTNTPLPRPSLAPYTPTPSCKLNGTIHIKNDTGGQVTLYLTGPSAFTFNLGTGNQSISVCPGSYSYTAYGCGGASRSGTIRDGEELKFWCD